jgi:hypothetical protein
VEWPQSRDSAPMRGDHENHADLANRTFTFFCHGGLKKNNSSDSIASNLF